jgi:hypothetical protein
MTISGVEGKDLLELHGAPGIPTALQAGFNQDNDLYRAAKQALMSKNYPEGSDLVLAGHSLGGMVCQQLASDPDIKKKLNVLNTVAYGSPPVTSHLDNQYEGRVAGLASYQDPVKNLSWNAIQRPLENTQTMHFVFLSDPHMDYHEQTVWDKYDVFGQKDGHVEISFAPHQIEPFPARPTPEHALWQGSPPPPTMTNGAQPEGGRDFKLGNFHSYLPGHGAWHSSLPPPTMAKDVQPEVGGDFKLGKFSHKTQEGLEPTAASHASPSPHGMQQSSPETHHATPQPGGRTSPQDSSMPQPGPTRTGATAAPDQPSASPAAYHSESTRAEERQVWKDKLGERAGLGRTESKAHEPGEERSITSLSKKKTH